MIIPRKHTSPYGRVTTAYKTQEGGTLVDVDAEAGEIVVQIAESEKANFGIDINDFLDGTANQVIVTDDGDGTATLSTPQDTHTGATPTFAGTTLTGELEMSDSSIDNVDSIDFNLSYAGSQEEGRVAWDSTNNTLSIGMPGGNVVLQVGQESLLYVKNQTGSDLANGKVVYITGAGAVIPTIAKASNDDSDKIYMAGILTEDISAGSFGFITVQGTVRDLNTLNPGGESWLEGDWLYLGTDGDLTNVYPPAVNAAVVIVAVVTRKHASTGTILMTTPLPFSIAREYNGTLRQSVINSSTGVAAGSSFTAVNDQGYRASLSIFGNSHATLPNVAGLYNEGYGATAFVTDGAEDFIWYTDPTDSHDFSALTNEVMRLKSAGQLSIGENISVGTSSPSASFAGEGDIYATSGIKAMEGLFSEAGAYGAGLEVSDNSLAVKYTNVLNGDATLTAATQIIEDTHASFDSTYLGMFLKVITATAGGSPGQYVGATGQIDGVLSGTTILVSFGTAGGDTIIDATAMSFVIYPEPRCFIGDNGDVHYCIGEHDDASFKICTDESNNEHAVHLVSKAGVDGNAALEIEYDPDTHSDTSAIEVAYDITAFDSDDTLGTILDVIIDNVGATAGDVHVIDVALSDTDNTDVEVEAVATHAGVDVIAQYLGDAAALDSAWSYNGSTFTDRTAAFNASGTNVEIFSGDNDYILLASTAKWDEINVLNATNSSRNIRAVFEYVEDDGTWTTFTPADDTNGFRRNGTIRFESDALTDWGQRTVNEVTGEAGAVDYYWIRITRTRNNIPTPPIESTIQVTTLGAKHHWDKEGNVDTKTIAVTDGITAPSTISGQAIIYVDTADGDLKVKFGDGTVKTLATD